MPGKRGQRLPVERRLLLVGVLVAGDEGDRRGVVAVGDRDAGIGGRGDARRDPGHDLERDSGLDAAPRPPRRRGRRRTGRRPSAARRCARPAARSTSSSLDLAPAGPRRRRAPCRRRAARRPARAPPRAPAGISRSWRITSAAAISSSGAGGHQARGRPGRRRPGRRCPAGRSRRPPPLARGSRAAPAAIIRCASSIPAAAGSEASRVDLVADPLAAVGKAGEAASSRIAVRRAGATIPTGVWQLAPSASTAARSALKAGSASRLGDRPPRRRGLAVVASGPASAIAPWPGAGVMSSVVEAERDLVLEPEPPQPGDRQHDAVEPSLGELRRAACRRCRAARRSRDRGGGRAAGRGAAGSRCRPCALGDVVERACVADLGVGGVLARGHRRRSRGRRGARRARPSPSEPRGRPHRRAGPRSIPRTKRDLSPSARVVGLDHDHLGVAELAGDQLGLREGQRAAAGPQAQGHWSPASAVAVAARFVERGDLGALVLRPARCRRRGRRARAARST